MKCYLSVLLVTLLIACHGPRGLQPADFAVGRLSLDADSATVIQLLGPPDSVRAEPGFGVDDHALLYWYAGAAVISFNTPNVVEGIAVASPAVATARGLRVGDMRARARQLYGAPLSDSVADQWTYVDEAIRPDHLIQLEFSGDTLVRIEVRHVRA